jgi:phosphatidate cytidylyltransferase
VNLNNFQTRSLTGATFAAAVVACVFISRTAFASAILIVNFVVLSEFLSLQTNGQSKFYRYFGLASGTISYLSVTLIALLPNPPVTLLLGINLALVPLLFISTLYHPQVNPFRAIGTTITGIMYISVPLSLLNFFNDQIFLNSDRAKYFLLGFFLLVWANDTFAYFTGVTIGKHPLFLRISPKKTWEGTIGGAVLTVLFSYLIYKYLGVLPLKNWLVISVLVIIFGTFGDLSESMIKRSANVKDSGNILPGHGGLLDRFDAILFAAPAVFIYLLIIHSFV